MDTAGHGHSIGHGHREPWTHYVVDTAGMDASGRGYSGMLPRKALRTHLFVSQARAMLDSVKNTVLPSVALFPSL